MRFNKKIISAVAAVAMVLTSFSAFTVASAAETLPTVTVNFIDSGMLRTGTDAGVKFTVSNLEKKCDTMSLEIQIPQDYIKLYDGGVYEITGGSDITDCMFEAARNTSFKKLKMKSATFQKQVGDLYQYKLDMSADTSYYISNNDSFEIDFVLDGKTWADAPVGSFAIQNVKFRYVGDLDTFEGSDKITVINNAEVKAPASTGTPSIGGTDKNAVESFAGYADAANLGVFTNPDLATDKAVAFKTTVTGTTATGVVVWKVTSNGVSKYHKMSIGNKLTGGGDAAIGLAVEGLDDSAATAGVAFLQ